MIRSFHVADLFSGSLHTTLWTSGIIGSAMSEDYALSSTTKIPDAERKLEIMLEVARRATWDALHGPKHLRSGRFRPWDALPRGTREATPRALAESAVQQGIAADEVTLRS